MDHLIPTVITDINGKTTTVHKKAVGKSPGLKKLPAPTVSKPAKKARESVLLPVPKPISSIDMQLMLTNSGITLGPKVFSLRHKIGENQSGVETIALAKDMLSNRRLSVDDITYILDDEATLLNCYNTHNALLVYEHLKNNGQVRDSDDRFALVQAVHGLAFHNSPRKRPLAKITTQEELEGYAAVAAFVIKASTEHAGYTGILKVDGTPLRSCYIVKNKHLNNLIKDHPSEVDRILAYVDARGMDKKAKEPVDELRLWLEETQGSKAVSDGWL